MSIIQISLLHALHSSCRRTELPAYRTLPVIFSKGLSISFIENVELAIKETPTHIKKMLADSRQEVVGTTMVTELFPELKGIKPRGWNIGTWEEAEGINRGNKIVVAEKHLISKSGESTKYTENKNVCGILRHEMGHSLFSLLTLADMENLQYAYKNDIYTFQNEEKEQLKYFLQPGEDGINEAFAETYAALQGGGCRHPDSFLNSFFYLKRAIKQILNI